MEKPSLRLMKIGTGLMVAGLVSLIIAIVGFASSTPAVGITFMILMVAFAAAAFIVAFVFWSRARRFRDQQRAALSRTQ
jgi:uncharacterized membrane-anchored protein